MTLYRAPFVVTGNGPVIEDGAVLVRGNIIAAVDRFDRLKNEAAKIVDCEGHILTPALINCHAHLELSWMAGILADDKTVVPGDISSWIAALLEKRDNCSPADEVITTAARKALGTIHENGTILVADIGNRDVSAAIGLEHSAEVLFFLEMMGLTKAAAQQSLDRLDGIDSCVTAHGLYSAHPELIQKLKSRALSRLDIFPIHVAESMDEVEFLQSGRGRLYDFLNNRLKQIGEFDKQSLSDVINVAGCRAVEYLDQLGILDEHTLCVHCVQVNEQEVELLALKNAKVCLCPRSNRYIGVGVAPLEMFLDKGILPGLGTDSLASNASLNIFAEMSALAADHPGVEPEKVFAMATVGGAQALNRSEQFGSIEPGKSASILAVEFAVKNHNEVYQFLVQTGEDIIVKWLEGFNE